LAAAASVVARSVPAGMRWLIWMVSCPEESMKLVSSLPARPMVVTNTTIPASTVIRRWRVAKRSTGR